MLRLAQNSRQDNLLKKTWKWEGLAISLTDSRLAYILVYREHPRFQKGISAWKKVNAFFSREPSFWAKVSRSGAKIDPFRGWKAAQSPYRCAVFQPHSCSSEDRQTAKHCLSASISRISFVKKSEIHFLYIFEGFLTSKNSKHTNKYELFFLNKCERQGATQNNSGIGSLT